MRIFISYSRQDLAHARALHAELTEMGHEPWLDLLNIRPGAKWESEIRLAIERADVVLLIVSPWSLASETVRTEWRHAREHIKETLLLAVQSVRPCKVLAALGAKDGNQLEQLQWIDVRAQPLTASQRVLAWIDDPSIARGNAFPVPPPRPLFFLDVVPAVAHVAAWAQILGGAACIGLLLVILRWLVRWQTTAALVFLDRLLITGFILLGLFGTYLEWSTIRKGLLAYYRKDHKPTSNLYEAALPLLAVAVLLIINGGFDFLIRWLRPEDFVTILLPELQLAYGVLFLLFGLLMLLIARWLRSSATLERWLPAYAEHQVKWRLPEGPRPWLSVDRAASAGVTSILANMPVQRVDLVFARQDAGFARSLRRFIVEQGIEIVQTCPDASDSALIAVLSPWAMADSRIHDKWRRAIGARVPVLPILLEDTQTPEELAQLNWIDARSDFAQARQDVLAALRDEPFRSGTQTGTPLRAPKRPSRIGTPGPRYVDFLSVALAFSSILKAMVVAVLFPIALWGYPELHPSHWVSAVAAILVAYLQGVAVGTFVLRRLSYTLMALVQVLCALAGLTLIGYLAPEIYWSVGVFQDRVMLVVLGIAEVIVLCLLLLPPIGRQWAPSGFVLKLDRAHPPLWYGYPVVLSIIAVVCALPVIGSAEDIRTSGGQVRYGETVLARLREGEPSHTWTFTAAPGDRVTLYVGAVSQMLNPSVTLLDGYENLLAADDDSGYYRDARISNVRAPSAGTYAAEVTAPVLRGVYRLTLSVRRITPQNIVCAETVRAKLAEATPWAEWEFHTDKRALVTIAVDRLNADRGLSLTVYDSTGKIVAVGDDDGKANDVLVKDLAVSAGKYTIEVSSYDGSDGAYQLSLLCDERPGSEQ